MSKILILEANYYHKITGELTKGAMDYLDEQGYEYDHKQIPGAFEIPTAISIINKSELGREYAGYIALGCVIRGETSHYDVICHQTAQALQHISIEKQVPIGFGILTCETEEQAWVRADTTQKNKGKEAAHACLELVKLASRCWM